MDDRLTAHSPARLLKEWDAGRAQAQLAGIAYGSSLAGAVHAVIPPDAFLTASMRHAHDANVRNAIQ